MSFWTHTLRVVACTAAVGLGYLIGPEPRPERKSPTWTWRSLLSADEQVRIAQPATARPSSWPALRELLPEATSEEMPEMFEAIWARLAEGERENWSKAAMVHWTSVDPEGALTLALNRGDSALGNWLKKEGVPFAFDRWARIAPLEAIAFHKAHYEEHRLYNIAFGDALADLPNEMLLELLTEEGRVMASQHAILEARFRRDPEFALVLLSTEDSELRRSERDFTIEYLDREDVDLGIRGLKDNLKADWGTLKMYTVWMRSDERAAFAHWTANRKVSHEILVATGAAREGPQAIIDQLQAREIEPSPSSLRPMAQALGVKPVPISEAVPLVDLLVRENYDPLRESIRCHDPFPYFKQQLNEHGWPPQGEAQSIVEELMEMPGGVARDALLGAAITAIGNENIDSAVSLATQASQQGAHWVFEGFRKQLDDRFDLQLEIAQTIEGAELEYFFNGPLGVSIREEPQSLANVVASMESEASAKTLTWHLMRHWNQIEPGAAKTWLRDRPDELQQWGEGALSEGLLSFRQYEEAANRLLAFEEPFREQDEMLRRALRLWGRKDIEQVEAAVSSATHLSADYREKLMNYVEYRERYELP